MLFNCDNKEIDSRIQALTEIGLIENKLWAKTIQLAYTLFKEKKTDSHVNLLETNNEFIFGILNGLWREDTEESKKCFIMICEKLLNEQNANAAGFLGMAYYEGKYAKPDKQKAISLLDLAYNWGNDWILPYYLDKLWQINDSESNDKYVKIATVESDKDNAEAKARLGRAYRDARSVVQNLDKAESLEREALAQGIKWAKYDLADVLWRKSTYSSLKEMSQLLDPLVKTNDYEAIARIARMYRDGKGKPKNIQLSKELFEKALSGGVKWAKTELDKLDNYETYDTPIYYSTKDYVYSQYNTIKTIGVGAYLKKINNNLVRWINHELILPNYSSVNNNYQEILQNRYSQYPKKMIRRNISWNIRALITYSLIKKQSSNNKNTKSVNNLNKKIINNPNSLVILFEIVGGVGDMLIAANYLWHFKEKFGKDHIHYDITSNNRQGINTVFKENDLIDSIYITINDKEKRELFSRYDMVVSIRRYPKIMRYDVSKISQYCPKLFEYIHTVAWFTDCNSRLLKGGIFDAQGALIEISKGRKRIQQIDVNNYLGITEEFKYPWFWDPECTILAQHNLVGIEYITVHRGNDTRYTKDSIKLWPVAYYDILLTKIKEKYPALVIVQLGVSHERCPLFKNVDIDLIEKTTLEDVKHLLKYSRIHIDCEGGFVHIRHAIHGGESIVLFGPTSDQFYGYSENINLHGTGCPTFCEWCTEGWQEKCIRGHKNNPCMQSIIPEQVFERFVDLYEGHI